jgi:hypothetical protein
MTTRRVAILLHLEADVSKSLWVHPGVEVYRIHGPDAENQIDMTTRGNCWRYTNDEKNWGNLSTDLFPAHCHLGSSRSRLSAYTHRVFCDTN